MLEEHLQAIFSKLIFQTHFKASPLLKGHPLFIYELLKHCNLSCLFFVCPFKLKMLEVLKELICIFKISNDLHRIRLQWHVKNLYKCQKCASKHPWNNTSKKIMWRGSSCQVWYAKAWKMWPQTLICKIILIGSSTYIYNRLTNANINYLKLKNGGKCVICVKFSHM
jgi:hypothetical protein